MKTIICLRPTFCWLLSVTPLLPWGLKCSLCRATIINDARARYSNSWRMCSDNLWHFSTLSSTPLMLPLLLSLRIKMGFTGVSLEFVLFKWFYSHENFVCERCPKYGGGRLFVLSVIPWPYLPEVNICFFQVDSHFSKAVHTDRCPKELQSFLTMVFMRTP